MSMANELTRIWIVRLYLMDPALTGRPSIMKTALLDEDHTLAIEEGSLVLRTLRSIPIRTLVIDAFNKTKAEAIQLSIGESFRWDLDSEDAVQDNFDEVLFDMLYDKEFLIHPEHGLTKRVFLVAVL